MIWAHWEQVTGGKGLLFEEVQTPASFLLSFLFISNYYTKMSSICLSKVKKIQLNIHKKSISRYAH